MRPSRALGRLRVRVRVRYTNAQGETALGMRPAPLPDNHWRPAPQAHAHHTRGHPGIFRDWITPRCGQAGPHQHSPHLVRARASAAPASAALGKPWVAPTISSLVEAKSWVALPSIHVRRQPRGRKTRRNFARVVRPCAQVTRRGRQRARGRGGHGKGWEILLDRYGVIIH